MKTTRMYHKDLGGTQIQREAEQEVFKQQPPPSANTLNGRTSKRGKFQPAFLKM